MKIKKTLFPETGTTTLSQEAVCAIMERFQEADPFPRSDLKSVNPYTFLVAVALSAQTTDARVNIATKVLFREVFSPEKMVAFGEERLRETIKQIGLYRTKARNVILLSQKLITDYESKVPERFEDLLTLPGVGRKTANVVLNAIYAQPRIGVDTHVFRVANRMGFVHEKTPEAVEKALLKTIPATFLRHAHNWFTLHGRYTCMARKPQCARCRVSVFCMAFSGAESV